MTREDRRLLLITLCGMLPYGVIVKENDGVNENDNKLLDIDMFDGCINYDYIIEDIKPYLRPMDSMTEEEEQYVLNTWSEDDLNNGIDLMYDNYMMLGYASDFIDWLNEHHFDYRGLIPMGLALEAPEDMYKTK